MSRPQEWNIWHAWRGLGPRLVCAKYKRDTSISKIVQCSYVTKSPGSDTTRRLTGACSFCPSISRFFANDVTYILYFIKLLRKKEPNYAAINYFSDVSRNILMHRQNDPCQSTMPSKSSVTICKTGESNSLSSRLTHCLWQMILLAG